MRLISELRERLRALLFRSREEREMDEEMAFHVEMETERLVREEGLPPDEARRRALLAFGGIDRYKEQVREARGVRVLEVAAQDVRYCVRTLWSSPGFTTVAVLTLALGIGASTAMFTVVHSVLLRPLDYAQAERLVAVWERAPDREGDAPTSPANYTEWRERSRSFEDLAAFSDLPLNLTGEGEAEQVVGRLTTANFFEVLGAGAHLGRTYADGDEVESVVVLAHDLWIRRYGGDPDLVGRGIEIGGDHYVVVGVMPPDFRSTGGEPDVWVPVELDPEWRGRYLQVVGRLEPGVMVSEAQTEMAALAGRLAEAFPEYLTGWEVDVVPLHQQVTGDVRPALLVLLGAVGLLLLIACTNVANLLLGRAVTRRREMAVRISLGATQGRILRQTLTESLLLAMIGGALGVGLAIWGTGTMIDLLPAELALPRMDEVRVDGAVLAFALGVSLATGLLFGIAPALSHAGANLAATLRDAARGTTGARSDVRRTLVVGQVALAVVLLVGAGLLGRSMQRLLEVETGVRTEGVLTASVRLVGGQYPDHQARVQFLESLLPRIEALPGVEAVGGSMYLPLTGAKMGHVFWRDDLRPAAGNELSTDIRVVTGAYFGALGIPVLRGRTFDDRDEATAPQAFIVNEALASRYFPGEDPIGKAITYPWIHGDVSGRIVGVVGNVREMGPTEDPAPAIYRDVRQMTASQMNLVIRTNGDPEALAPAVTAAVRSVDPDQPVARLRTMEQVAAATVARERVNVWVMGGFAAMALLLAGLGIYGVVSYAVTQRRHEIGVRLALGAGRADVFRLVLRQAMGLVAVGLVLGIGAALALGRLMSSMLFGIGTADPLTLMGVTLFLAAVALVASWVPGRRATRFDPVIALAGE